MNHKFEKPIRAKTPDDSVMLGIELAGNANIHLARAGRAMQFMAPAIQSWLNKEYQRGQKIDDILSTFDNVIAQIVATQIYRFAGPDLQDAVAHAIADHFREQMLSALKAYRENGV